MGFEMHSEYIRRGRRSPEVSVGLVHTIGVWREREPEEGEIGKQVSPFHGFLRKAKSIP